MLGRKLTEILRAGWARVSLTVCKTAASAVKVQIPSLPTITQTEEPIDHGISIKVIEDGDALQIKVGHEITRISVRDGLTDDASLLVKDLHTKIQRCIHLQRTRIDRQMAAIKKQMKDDAKQLDILLNKAMRPK